LSPGKVIFLPDRKLVQIFTTIKCIHESVQYIIKYGYFKSWQGPI